MPDTDSIASLLSRLVAFRSVEGRSEDKAAVMAFAAGWLREHGVAVTEHAHPECPSLTATAGGGGKPILLLSHLDVVPAPEAMFTMAQKDGKAFGRGVLDDKGPAAILMLLMAEAASRKDWPAVMLCLTSDEEIGSEVGVERLLREGVFAGTRGVMALDGGGERKVVYRGKGVLHFTLEAEGKAMHNSTPWDGDNAIEKLYRTYERIKAAIAPSDPPADRWHHTVSIGVIGGGEFVNQVPAKATAQIDCRFTDDLNTAELRGIAEGCLEDGVTMTKAEFGDPFETDRNDPLLRAYVAAMATTMEDEIDIVSEHGATDARFFRSAGIPIWVHDPHGDGMHTDDEWLDLASAARVLEGLRRFLSSGV